MNTKKLSILLAAVVLIAAQLACAAGEPTFDNVRSSSDSDGAQRTSTFGASDTLYVVGDITNGAVGNQVVSRWYIENAAGFDPNFFMDEIIYTVEEDGFTGIVTFSFEPPADGWPAATYRVEVYFNGALVSTVNFTVQ